MSYFSELF